MTEGCLVNANCALTPLLSQRLLSLRCVSSSHKNFFLWELCFDELLQGNRPSSSLFREASSSTQTALLRRLCKTQTATLLRCVSSSHKNFFLWEPCFDELLRRICAKRYYLERKSTLSALKLLHKLLSLLKLL